MLIDFGFCIQNLDLVEFMVHYFDLTWNLFGRNLELGSRVESGSKGIESSIFHPILAHFGKNI